MFPAYSRLLIQHDVFVGRAQNHKTVLRGIMAEARTFSEDTWAILLADMDYITLKRTQLHPFRNTLHRVLIALYHDKSPAEATLCWDGGASCNIRIGDMYTTAITDTLALRDLSEFVFFRLHDDLRVELLRELPPELGIVNAESYQPERHIDFDAPLPTRAITMLGMTRD